jgi:hypothetical protein
MVARCTPAQAGVVTLSVTEGTEPTFTWEPACAVDLLRVEYPDPDYPASPEESPPVQLAWLWAGGLSGQAPPLRYATPMPFGFPEIFPAEPLVVGRTYTVRLLVDGPEIGSDVEVAHADFVP